ncbi:hypothetical protein [Pseudonocardia lacus]|uniref:hypothetical protein n=1 Tax=Pseudonocardia lacus TaxID=2835865 RepID=UPI001BDC233C|nr:hypothetical protein [Pseudonocardia lacus]
MATQVFYGKGYDAASPQDIAAASRHESVGDPQVGLLLAQTDPVAIVTVMEYQARSGYVSARPAPNDKRYEVRNAMIMEAERMSEPVAALWKVIMDRVAPPPF